MVRYDDLLSFCSPYHIYNKCLDFTDILAFEINVHYMLSIIFQKVPEADPLALAYYAC